MACHSDEEGLMPAPAGASFYPLWHGDWQDGAPLKPFPNNDFINDSGYIEMHAPAEAAYYASLLAAERFFAPDAPLYIPFSSELASGWEYFDGYSLAPILLVNIEPASPQFGKPADYRVLADLSRGDRLYLQPLDPLEAGARYAVVIFQTLTDKTGGRVGSPLAWVNYPPQNDDLRPLLEEALLDKLGFKNEQIAFMWSFTVREVYRELLAAAQGIYGRGNLGSLENHQPARLRFTADAAGNYLLPAATFAQMVREDKDGLFGLEAAAREAAAVALLGSLEAILFGTLDSMELMGALGDYYEKELLVLSPQLERIKHLDIPYLLALPAKAAPAEKRGTLIYIPESGESAEAALLKTTDFLSWGYMVVIMALPASFPAIESDLVALKHKWLTNCYHILQLERTLAKLNCASYWPYDFNGDGLPELAGDFAGDGKCESASPIVLAGEGAGAMLVLMAGTVAKSQQIIAIDPRGNWADLAAKEAIAFKAPLFAQQILADFDPRNFLWALSGPRGVDLDAPKAKHFSLYYRAGSGVTRLFPQQENLPCPAGGPVAFLAAESSVPFRACVAH